MPIAHVRVTADRTVQVTAAGTTSQHPDVGAAIAHLTALAREQGSELTVKLDDHGAQRTLHIDASGRLRTLTEAEVASAAEGTAETGQGDDGEDPEGIGSGAHAPQHPLTAPEAQADYPVRDRFSGPADPTGPPTGSIPEQKSRHNPGRQQADRQRQAQAGTPRRRAKRARSRLQMSGLTVPTLVLAILLIIALAAYIMPRIIGTPESQAPESIPAAHGAATQQSLSMATGSSAVPGFEATPAWEETIPPDASVTATARGVVVVTNSQLQVLDARTGQQRFETDIDEPPSFAVDTVIDGRSALVWRIGDRAYALVDGSQQPYEYELPRGARISSAGTNVLIKNGDELSTFARDGLTRLPTPAAGSTPMALDGGELVSATFAGPLTVTDVESGEERTLDLEAPRDDLQIIRWVTAGHGKVVTLWGQPGASTNSGHRIQLVVHSLSDGTIASTVSTTTDTVGEADWVRGQGYQLAVIGPYLFSMEDGLLVRDGSESNARFSEPRGHMVPAVIDNTPVLVSADTAWQVRTNLLAVTAADGYAITREGADRVVGYRSEQ